jgi:drug/metabolite transporter (DMT)-like permease
MIVGCFIISYHQTHSPIDKNNPLLGYSLVILATIIVAFTCVGIRMMNQKVHFLIFPFYFIIGLQIINLFAYLFIEDAINIHKYTPADILTNAISSAGSLVGV